MDEFQRTERLRQETERERIVFTETEIEVGTTLLRLAVTEMGMGKPARADDLLAKARLAHETAAQLLAQVGDGEERRRLRDKRQVLTDAIQETERKRRQEEAKADGQPSSADLSRS